MTKIHYNFWPKKKNPLQLRIQESVQLKQQFKDKKEIKSKILTKGWEYYDLDLVECNDMQSAHLNHPIKIKHSIF
jgi:hypothetical protein